jgi:hypothetical protein
MVLFQYKYLDHSSRHRPGTAHTFHTFVYIPSLLLSQWAHSVQSTTTHFEKPPINNFLLSKMLSFKPTSLLLATLATNPLLISATPVPDASTETVTTIAAPNTSLEERGTGIYLNAYHSGSCDRDIEGASGWVWAGQCKNLEAGTYGAKPSDVDYPWPESCVLKFWEKSGCHGKATVHHVADYEHIGSINWGLFDGWYNCIPVANKKSSGFYLGGGAASVLMTC